MSKKRILVLTPRFPFPAIGGDKLHIYHVIKYLAAQKHELTLVSLYETEEEAQTEAESGLFQQVYKIKQPKWRSRMQTLQAILTGQSLQTAYYDNSEITDLMKELAPQHDMLFSHLIRMAPYCTPFKEIPKVCDMVDAISMMYERASSFKRRSLKNWIYRIEKDRCLRVEQECLQQFDTCYLLSEVDKAFLQEQTPGAPDNISVISNGVDLDYFSQRSQEESEQALMRQKIVFAGNMRSEQNTDAALYFAKEVFPSIRTAYPQASFWMIGANPPDALKQLHQPPYLHVTGAVPSMVEACRDATVNVCPMRIGAGIQNKLLEAMSMGIPNITSSVGLEGIRAIPGQDLLVADTPESVLEQVRKLFENPEVFQRLSTNGRKFVEQHHHWNQALAPLSQL